MEVHSQNPRPGSMHSRCYSAVWATAFALAIAVPAHAQTDYFNTDTGRPLTIEDAYPTERYAFELQLAPLRMERMHGGTYRWSVEPEIAYGIFPRTQIEVGAPVSYLDARAASGKAGLAGIELALLHNLNLETSIPALAVAGDVLLPVGRYAPDEAVFSAKAIATRTFRWARFHVNGQYTFGAFDRPPEGGGDESASGDGETSRWLAGVAVDRTFPLGATLVGAELFARRARFEGADAEWNAAIGVRRQLSPAFNVDAGIGRQLTGEERSWFVTIGVARAFAVRSLMPGR
jgi:hypothetical protein